MPFQATPPDGAGVRVLETVGDVTSLGTATLHPEKRKVKKLINNTGTNRV
jgi:hypothetical protein